METNSEVKVNLGKAIKLHKSSDEKTKKNLEKLFGKEIFKPKVKIKVAKPKPVLKPHEKIKSFEDACKKLKIKSSLSKLPDGLFGKHHKAIVAIYNLTIIVEALNDGWVADFSNSNQYKYWNWFEVRSGSGFSFSLTGTLSHYDNTYTDVGVCLCFEKREVAEYAGKQFLSLYNDWLSPS